MKVKKKKKPLSLQLILFIFIVVPLTPNIRSRSGRRHIPVTTLPYSTYNSEAN